MHIITRHISVLAGFAMLCLGGVLACVDTPTYVDVRDPNFSDPNTFTFDSGQVYRRPECATESYTPPLALAGAPVSTLVGHPALTKLKADLPPFVEVTPREDSLSTSASQTSHMNIGFSVAGINLCQYHGRLHVDRRGEGFVKGKLPTSLTKAPAMASLKWQENNEEWVRAATRRLELSPDALALYQSKRCLWVQGEAYAAAWQLDFFVDEAPYRAQVIDGELREVSPLFFSLTASTMVFDHNSLSGNLVKVDINHMQDNGYLCSQYLTTRVPRYRQLAYSPELVFHYPIEDKRFLEVSAFTSVALMWDWFLAKRPHNWSRIPVELVITQQSEREISGPVYMNPELAKSRDRPTIYVPDVTKSRDGRLLLKNLSTDSEALSHELGHHILFQYVGFDSAASEEHAALHEAIPDFFVFAKTGDPCLAESICTSDSSLCTGDKTCLRTALNDLTFNGAEYQQLYSVHAKGQLITGFLWDLFKVDQIPLDYLGDLVFAAMPYMDISTSFADFLQALLKAEESINANKNQCTIVRRAIARGFSELLAPTTCT